MTQDEIIRSPLWRDQIIDLAREAGFVSPSAAIHQIERFFNLAFEAGAAYEREVCAKESLEVLDNLRKETIAQCQKGMIEAYKLGQSEEREACAKVCEEISQDHWNLYKGRPPYTGSEAGRADPHEQGVSMGASDCATVIRARGEK